MNCPACGRSLQPLTVDGAAVHACHGGCAGIWFDHADVKSIADRAEADGEYVQNSPRDPSVNVDLGRRRRCPRCPDSVLMRHYSSVSRSIVVDECPTCAGVWLDAGELEAIRSEHPSAPPRHQETSDNLDAAVSELASKWSRSAVDTRISWSRPLFSLLAGLYLVSALKHGDLATTQMLMFCVLPMACIWFPDALGGYIGGRIDRESPPRLVFILGWVILLVPLLERIMWSVRGARWVLR
jgi:Zn-finger nucleic acid-binding protein